MHEFASRLKAEPVIHSAIDLKIRSLEKDQKMLIVENSSNNILPQTYSMQFLEKNLAALTTASPKLALRISWPVGNDHVIFEKNGKPQYCLHAALLNLSICKRKVGSILRKVLVERDIFVFGIGLGEHIKHLLKRFPGSKIMAWEKDPWLLRLFLMQSDYSEPLTSGSLNLFMAADLVDLIPKVQEAAIVFHPLLKHVYYNEAQWLHAGVTQKRVLVNSGGLLVDDAAASLKQNGYTPLIMDLDQISLEEIDYTIHKFRPNIIFSINYQNGLSELSRKHGIPMLCWEIDPAVDVPHPLKETNHRAYIFTYRKQNIQDFLSAGFQHVEYLPMATDTNKRKPMRISVKQKPYYTAAVSFVGSTLLQQASEHRKTLTDLYEHYRNERGILQDPLEDPFREILDIQSQDYTTYRIPDLFQERLSDFLQYFKERFNPYIDPIRLLAETAAAEKRLKYISRLKRWEVKVWGDEGWQEIAEDGIVYMGCAGHHKEINKIYSAAKINVEVNRIYQPEIVTMRVFDVMACGGFLIAEHAAGMEELFDVGREIVTYRTLDELLDKIAYYLNHPKEAKAIAASGKRAVQNRHTIKMRIDHILRALT